MGLESVGTPTLWIGFILLVFAMLALDLGVFHRDAHAVNVREALVWTCVWIALSLAASGGIYFMFGQDKALEFLTGYIIEKALSVDNIFVFVVVFAYFQVPPQLQHRVLFWGILGALVMRAIFILAGAALLQHFHWIFYIFGAFLVYTGFKIMIEGGAEVHPERNPVLRIFGRFVPSVKDYRGQHFTVVENGKRFATPLLMVLLVVEATDVLFAVDSIPAIFGITTDPFIVFTSNIFAILGLRAMYFVLAGVMDKFHYLKYGLGLVLIFVGIKMLIAEFFHYKIPIELSLGVVAALLGLSVAASLLWPAQSAPLEVMGPPGEPVPHQGEVKAGSANE